MKKYIEQEAAKKTFCKLCYYQYTGKCKICPVDTIPTADVVDGETYRELLKAARKMHCWIFLNTADELEAYDECGLTDEMNAMLGYGGQFTAKMDGGADDGRD